MRLCGFSPPAPDALLGAGAPATQIGTGVKSNVADGALSAEQQGEDFCGGFFP